MTLVLQQIVLQIVRILLFKTYGHKIGGKILRKLTTM